MVSVAGAENTSHTETLEDSIATVMVWVCWEIALREDGGGVEGKGCACVKYVVLVRVLCCVLRGREDVFKERGLKLLC